MIKVSILYPYTEGSSFDIEYYVSKHVPMCQELMGEPLRRVEIDEGVAGGVPGSKPPFVAAVHLYFDSKEAFFGAFAPHASVILKDIPNYTTIKPITQISTLR